MVYLTNQQPAEHTLYLELRRVAVDRVGGDIHYHLQGIVGDGCAEAHVEVELAGKVLVEIIPIVDELCPSSTLCERVCEEGLKKSIIEGLSRIYFCLENSKETEEVEISAYAEQGRLVKLLNEKEQFKPVIREAESEWKRVA